MLLLAFIIILIVYRELLSRIESPIILKIENANTMKEAFAYRTRLRLFRYGFSFAFILLLWLCVIFFCFFLDKSDLVYPSFVIGKIVWYDLLNLAFLTTILMPFVIYFRKLNGNISLYTKSTFLKKRKTFILFLRGFRSDDYSSYDLLKDTKVHYGFFSEYRFVESYKKHISHIPLCAVGMTKEADSPLGATRIYIEDATWKEDVLELMEKAFMIYILVDDRPSCVWEIAQSSKFLNKTVFMVDSEKKYNHVRTMLGNPKFFPEVIGMNSFYIRNGNETEVQSFINTIGGYEDIIIGEEIINTKETILVALNEKKLKFIILCLYVIALFVLASNML